MAGLHWPYLVKYIDMFNLDFLDSFCKDLMTAKTIGCLKFFTGFYWKVFL